MSWRYALLKKNNVYQVCEYYVKDKKIGYTGAIAPMGETKEELLQDLERMIEDIKFDIKHNFVVEWQEDDVD